MCDASSTSHCATTVAPPCITIRPAIARQRHGRWPRKSAGHLPCRCALILVVLFRFLLRPLLFQGLGGVFLFFLLFILALAHRYCSCRCPYVSSRAARRLQNTRLSYRKSPRRQENIEPTALARQPTRSAFRLCSAAASCSSWVAASASNKSCNCSAASFTLRIILSSSRWIVCCLISVASSCCRILSTASAASARL